MDTDVGALAAQVVALGAVLGLALGAVSQASRFCTMGALTDLYTFQDGARLRQWVLAGLVAVLGTQALLASGAVRLDTAIYLQPRLNWLSHLVGGVLFGLGMVLASGCGTRSLVRAGSGSLKAVVVVIVLAVTAQMSLRGLLALPRVNGLDPVAVDLGGPADLPSLLARLGGLPEGATRLALLALLTLAAGAWIWRGRAGLGRSGWLGGLAVGGLTVLAWWVTGGLAYLPEHPDTLEAAWLGTASRRPEGLSFVAPVGASLGYLELASDRNTVLNFGIALVAGTLLGSLASALARRQFRLETFASAEDTLHHLMGAGLMGFGGVLAVGCTVGQGLSGVSLLSVGAPLALAGFVVGSYLAWRYLSWRLERAAVVCDG